MCLLRQFISKCCLGKVSCFVSPCVSSDNSFPSVGQESTQGPFLQQMATQVGSLLCYDWHPDHSGCLGTSLPADGLSPAATTGILLSLFFLHRQQARVTWLGKEQETLLISFPCFSLPLLFSTLLSYPFFFYSGSGHRSLVEGPQPDLRVGAWSLPEGRKLEFPSSVWHLVSSFWLGQFPVLLFCKPREKFHNAWASAGSRRRL